MKKLILLASILILVGGGCTPMTNQEIVAETKFCEDNGMKAVVGHIFPIGGIETVTCYPSIK